MHFKLVLNERTVKKQYAQHPRRHTCFAPTMNGCWKNIRKIAEKRKSCRSVKRRQDFSSSTFFFSCQSKQSSGWGGEFSSSAVCFQQKAASLNTSESVSGGSEAGFCVSALRPRDDTNAESTFSGHRADSRLSFTCRCLQPGSQAAESCTELFF